MSAAKSLVFKWIKEDVDDEIQEKLKAIPEKYIPRIKWEPDKFDIDIHNLESYIESHLIQEPDYDYKPHSSSESYIDSLDCIFDRF